MKKKFSISTLFISAAIMVTNVFPVLAIDSQQSVSKSIVANHENATLADLKSIPDNWIEKAKDELHIVYGHTSHGSQVSDGMGELVNFLGDKYTAYSNKDGKDGVLDFRDTPDNFATDLGNGNWSVITDYYLMENPDINVVMWSWCGQVSWMSEEEINTYLTTMTELENKYPNVTFVYMTGHLDGSGLNGNLNLRNEQIREYCELNGKVLFDFADIESYDPDGNYYLDKGADDACQYDSDNDGSNDSNWAINWQNTHVQDVEWYSCSAAHSEALNGNMKAYAAWHLWATLAGYNQEVIETTPITTTTKVETTQITTTTKVETTPVTTTTKVETTPITTTTKVETTPVTTTTKAETTTVISFDTAGDINGDNRVDNLDLVMLSQYLLNEIDLSEKVLKLVDVNLDKVVDIADLALIKQYIMGDKVILGNK